MQRLPALAKKCQLAMGKKMLKKIDSSALGFGGDRLLESLQVEKYQEKAMRFPSQSPKSNRLKKIKKLVSEKERTSIQDLGE